jgi:uncharacterized iron-regulated membrane protein
MPDAPLHLSTQTRDWLTDHPQARTLVRSVWDTLAELEQAGQHPGPIDALRRVLTHHQPTRPGRAHHEAGGPPRRRHRAAGIGDQALASARATGLSEPVTITTPDESGAPYTVAKSSPSWPIQRNKVAIHPRWPS